MKRVYKYLSAIALSAAMCLLVALPASAQHDHQGGGGGGGGGSRPASSGGGGHVSVAPQRSAAPSVHTNTGQHSYSQRPTTNNNQHYNYNMARPNSNYAGHTAAPRTGVTAQGHGYSGSAYGRTHVNVGVVAHAGYLPGNTAYHYNHGYYGSYYGPRLGFSVGFLPYGYYPFYFGDYQYFYSAGLFYQYNNDQYTVVEPPVGAEVTTLPSNAQSIVINGQQYYEVNGVYYEPITKDDGTLSYQVAGKDGELNTDNSNVDNAPAAPQMGDIVTQLPPNCRKINVNGQKLYISPDGIYYQAQADQSGNTVYKIVGLPDEDQNQDQGTQGGSN